MNTNVLIPHDDSTAWSNLIGSKPNDLNSLGNVFENFLSLTTE